MNIPKQLISLLNSGRCVAIVGSGPSCELGYPSWDELAKDSIAHATNNNITLDSRLFSRLMTARDYPRVFKYLQDALGRHDLVQFLQARLSIEESSGTAYGLLAKWPFRFYMTTNWDSAIKSHLARLGHHFTELGNSRPEITQITDDTSRQIIKLHGQLTDPSTVVLTEDDYQAFKVSDERKYFRETLKSVLRTLPAVVVGHSMSDPDLQTILEAAKTIAPSHRPIYMILADPEREDIDTFRERYNISLIGYGWDPTHSHFLRLLSMIDKFVVPRTGAVIRPVDPPPQQEIEVATSLLVFNSLNKSMVNKHLVDRLVYPQVLQRLTSNSSGVRATDVRDTLIPEALRTMPGITRHLQDAFAGLQAEGYVAGSDLEGWTLTQKGDEYLSGTSAAEKFQDDQVYGALEARAKSLGTSEADCTRAAQSLKTAILSVFRKRGVAAASLIFRGQKFEPVDMAELFEAIATSIQWCDSFALREAFVDFALRLFTQPTEQERQYLARVSQGFFAVHVFGADPVTADAKADVFRHVKWFLDSNVLIHLLAQGSPLNEMAVGICDKCRALNIQLFASEGVVTEAFSALEWASSMCSGLQPHEEMQFILRVLNEEGYRENPYIAAFVNLQHKMKMQRFSEYRNHLTISDRDSLIAGLAKHNISVLGIDSLPQGHVRRKAFSLNKNKILVEREKRHTARGGGFQAEVEAELLCLILSNRDIAGDGEKGLSKAYFVSTSRLLDFIFGRDYGTLTWHPDVFFRSLSLISPSEGDTEGLIESLGTELAEMGVTLVDEDAFQTYFNPLISSSRLSFERERELFVRSLEDDICATPDELQREFDLTPNSAKPRFVRQMESRVGAAATAELRQQLAMADRQRQELAAKLKMKEEEWKQTQQDTVRHLENRIRNLTDPTRSKKLKRKSRNKRKRRKGK